MKVAKKPHPLETAQEAEKKRTKAIEKEQNETLSFAGLLLAPRRTSSSSSESVLSVSFSGSSVSLPFAYEGREGRNGTSRAATKSRGGPSFQAQW